MNNLLNGYTAALRGAIEAGVNTLCLSDRRFVKVADDICSVQYMAQGALLYAYGAALAGERSVAICRDLSVDELASVAHCGVSAAMVIIYVDNDNRPYFDMHTLSCGCHLPILEPSTVYECKTYVKIACNLSEKYDTPVFVHISQALLDTTEQVDLTDPKQLHRKPYKRNRDKYVTLPTTNRLCAEDMDVRDRRLQKDCDLFPIHTVEYRDKQMGIICYGSAYAALLAAAPHVSVLRLGTSYPLPLATIRSFAASVEDVIVLEEGEPLIESILCAQGIKCHGNDIFPLRMHYTPADIKERLLGVEVPHEDVSLPIRTPAFCSQCPLIDLFTVFKKADVVVHADTYCALLGADIPMVCVDSAISDSPVALGAGFARYQACVCVLDAMCVRLSDLTVQQKGQTVVIYGDVESLPPILSALGVAWRQTTVDQLADLLCCGQVLLVPLAMRCKQ